jgi:hypothetical protein
LGGFYVAWIYKFLFINKPHRITSTQIVLTVQKAAQYKCRQRKKKRKGVGNKRKKGGKDTRQIKGKRFYLSGPPFKFPWVGAPLPPFKFGLSLSFNTGSI